MANKEKPDTPNELATEHFERRKKEGAGKTAGYRRYKGGQVPPIWAHAREKAAALSRLETPPPFPLDNPLRGRIMRAALRYLVLSLSQPGRTPIRDIRKSLKAISKHAAALSIALSALQGKAPPAQKAKILLQLQAVLDGVDPNDFDAKLQKIGVEIENLLLSTRAQLALDGTRGHERGRPQKQSIDEEFIEALMGIYEDTGRKASVSVKRDGRYRNTPFFK